MVNEPLEPDAIESTSEERNLAMMMHLLGGLFGFLAPLLFWLAKKDDSRFIDQHGREALNLQFSSLIYSFAIGILVGIPLFLLTFFTMGMGAIIAFPVLFVAIGLLLLYLWGCCILAATQAHRGGTCRCPLTIHLFK